ncbi:MAG: YggW family oxidoreductase [Gammaproteobacteria bacterium]|nr:MAG: YggW family oxidoreductase [Gammaproteobacteria bacterium]
MPARQFSTLPPLSLYVHLPWCVKKCPYCDFNSHELKRDLPENAYIDALLADLAASLPDVQGRRITSVFIGGGTPSLFSGAAIDRFMRGLRALITLSLDAEVTMEANPGTAEQLRFDAYRKAGINRLSIGVQSFDNDKLRALGRIHSGEEAVRAMTMARRAGFERVNLDLMLGLPGQTEADARADLEQALALEPEHLSLYELTLEPNTPFHRTPPAGLPAEDEIDGIQQLLHELLPAAGLDRYEVSAWARRGEASRHNLNYWRYGDYLGIGAGAHGKITRMADMSIRRTRRPRHPRRYLAAEPPQQEDVELVPVEDSAIDFMMNALRLTDGFPLPLFEAHTGVPLDIWQAAMDDAMARELLEISGMTLRPTARGSRYLNSLLELFLPETPKTRCYPIMPLLAE